jgi:cell division protein FtsL
MSRLAAVGTVLLAVASAFVLYAVTYETRRLEQHVSDQARIIEKTRLDIAVLRAERAYLARPERIEEMARKIGLAPIDPRQFEAFPKSGGRRSSLPGEQRPSPAGEQRPSPAGEQRR